MLSDFSTNHTVFGDVVDASTQEKGGSGSAEIVISMYTEMKNDMSQIAVVCILWVQKKAGM